MQRTTLCYIEQNNKYLMLHRTKKQNDDNAGKWIGIGGKIEEGETPLDCVLRETYEETGLILTDPVYRGIVHFRNTFYTSEDMYLFTANKFHGVIKECTEGDLHWIDKNDIYKLNLWEGDKIFLEALKKDNCVFYLTLNYDKDNLISHSIQYSP